MRQDGRCQGADGEAGWPFLAIGHLADAEPGEQAQVSPLAICSSQASCSKKIVGFQSFLDAMEEVLSDEETVVYLPGIGISSWDRW